MKSHPNTVTTTMFFALSDALLMNNGILNHGLVEPKHAPRANKGAKDNAPVDIRME